MSETQILLPPTSAECRAWADEMTRQAELHESRGHTREATDCRRHAEDWTRSAAIAAEREGALW